MTMKIAVSDYAKMIGKSRTSIIKMINKGLLDTGYVEKDGRRVKAIIIEDEQMLSVNTKNDIFHTPDETCHMGVTPPLKEDVTPENQNSDDDEDPDVINVEYSKEEDSTSRTLDVQFLIPLFKQIKDSQQHFVTYNQQLTELHKQMVSYAELAGQAKLLTDSENKTKEEYFRVMQENATLKTEVKQLHDKLKAQEESSFVSWLKKL